MVEAEKQAWCGYTYYCKYLSHMRGGFHRLLLPFRPSRLSIRECTWPCRHVDQSPSKHFFQGIVRLIGQPTRTVQFKKRLRFQPFVGVLEFGLSTHS